MKVVRRITYEAPDTLDGQRRLKEQMQRSVRPGRYNWLTDITIEHVEGVQWDEDGMLAVFQPTPKEGV